MNHLPNCAAPIFCSCGALNKWLGGMNSSSRDHARSVSSGDGFAATEGVQLRQLSERLREMAKWHLEGFADHITLVEAADVLSALHDTHGAKRVSAPDMVQTCPDEL